MLSLYTASIFHLVSCFVLFFFFFFSSRRRHTRCSRDWSSDVCSSDLASADKSVEENRQAALRFAEIFVRMRRIPKPIVAVVQGRALAGGCGLATACEDRKSTRLNSSHGYISYAVFCLKKKKKKQLKYSSV